MTRLIAGVEGRLTAIAVAALLLAGLAGSLSTKGGLDLFVSHFDPVSVVILLVLSAALLISGILIVREYPSLGLWNPGILIVIYLLVAYVLRPVFVIGLNTFGTSFVQLDPTSDRLRMTISLILLTASITGFFMAYMLASPTAIGRLIPSDFVPRTYATIVLFVVFMVSASVGLYIARQASGSSGTLQLSIANRADFYSGRNYLLLIITLYRGAFFAWLCVNLDHNRDFMSKRWKAIMFFWLLSLPLDLVTGGRGEMLLFNIVPFIALIAYTKLGSSIPKILLVLALVLGPVFVVTYRAVVRDTQNLSGDVSVSERIKAIPSEFLGGNETTNFDAMVIIMDSVPTAIPYRGIPESIEVIATRLLPSSLFPWKPASGTAALTYAIAPEVTRRKGDLTFSAPGDLYYSAGPIAVLVGVVMLGWLAGLLIRGSLRVALRNRSSVAFMFSWISVGGIFSLLRTDLSPLSISTVKLVVFLLFVHAMASFARGKYLDQERTVVTKAMSGNSSLVG